MKTQQLFDWPDYDIITGFEFVSKKQESATEINKKVDRREYYRWYWMEVKKKRKAKTK